ncbi:MAG: helix-turn-helix domain-containing protein [Candidatus Onthovivens sp.]|nr:helix-turn-helix domain-containing protein [Candidatus Onthovivens sp.]
MKEGYSICFNEWALDKDIKDELGLLLIISSLTAEKGYCYASNDYLAKIFETSVVTISRKIKILEEKKYIKIEYEKKGCLVISRKIRLTKMLTAINKNVNRTVNKNVKENNISNINNTNINNKKERKKETNYDKIINSMVEDEEIKNSIYEFIKMRKLIKKPMTDRALTMLINKLEKLSSDKDIQIKILEKSILKNWTDIYELKGDKNDGYIRECSNDDGSEYAEFV